MPQSGCIWISDDIDLFDILDQKCTYSEAFLQETIPVISMQQIRGKENQL